MEASSEYTKIGGISGDFKTTCWTEIGLNSASSEAQRKAFLNALMLRYWRPVYIYLRRKGYSNDAAKDTTQGFFADAFVEKDILASADASRGRFRSYLLSALNNYAISANRRATAKKRAPNELISLDNEHLPGLPAHSETPDQAFIRQWASDLVYRALDTARQDCEQAGQREYWSIFQGRILKPILEGGAPVPLEQLILDMDINTTQAASRVQTVKRRFRRALLMHVRTASSTEQDLVGDEEQCVNNILLSLQNPE